MKRLIVLMLAFNALSYALASADELPRVGYREVRYGKEICLVPSMRHLCALFEYCYRKGLQAQVAISHLEENGIKPVKTEKLRLWRVTLILYRTYERGDMFYAVFNGKGHIWRWGTYL